MLNFDQLTYLQCSEETIKKFDLQVKDKRELVNLINESFYRANKIYKTSKERFECLLLRDKVLKLIRYEIHSNPSYTLEHKKKHVLVGTCLDMCPEKERYSREYLSLLHKYELNAQNQPDHFLMIKEYSRSSADQDLPLPNEMRPLETLFDTMLFIIDAVISKIETYSNSENEFESSEFSLGDWYDFVWNRTRSIRKDIIQQRLLINDSSSYGIEIIEQCARFHIMCSHRLCDQPSQVFDFKINEENLKNCFQSLRQYYETSREDKQLEPSRNEAEFRAYIILLNLNETNILGEIQRWPKHIRHSSQVRFALKLYFTFNSRNYVNFFNLIKSDQCEYLQACILHRYFFKVRHDSFKMIFSSFRENKERVFPLQKLLDLLGFDSVEDVYEYLNVFGLESSEDGNLVKSKHNLEISNIPKSEQDSLRLKRSNLVENKFYYRLKQSHEELTNEDCLSEIISGIAIEQVKKSRFLYEDYELRTSFDSEGRFRTEEIDAQLEEAEYFFKQNTTLQTKLKLNLKSVQHQSGLNKLVFKTANDLKKKAMVRQNSHMNTEISGIAASLKRERKKSGSSTGSSVELQEEASTAPSKKIFFEPIAPQQQQNLFTSIINKKTNINLFESIIKKQEQPPLVPKLVVPVVEDDKPKIIENLCNNVYETLLNETLFKFVKEFYVNFDNVSKELLNYIIEITIKEELSKLFIAEIQENLKLKSKNEILNSLTEQIYNYLLKVLVEEYCEEFLNTSVLLENTILDNLLCSVFQKEFELILKQIANEINNDLILDKLSESFYFDDSVETSIYTQDLVSYLHQCIYEFTRLNLNVNRELYYEINQSINLNQQLYLFKKWRLKLSQKLLNRQQRRASLGQEKQSLIFMNTYSEYLLKNLNKLGKLSMFMGPDYKYLIVHSDLIHKHLSLNIKLNFSQTIFDFLYENFFSLIHNRENEISMNIPLDLYREEICVKCCVLDKLEHDWLKKKLFGEVNNNLVYESNGIDLLEPDKFGVKLCFKFVKSQDSIETTRSLFGTSSVLYVLEPIKTTSLNDYIVHVNKDILNLVSKINKNDSFLMKNLNYLFISYLDKEQSMKIIESLRLEKYNLCLIENDSNLLNGFLLQSFVQDLVLNELKQYHNKSPVFLESMNLFDLLYLSLIKFLDFVEQTLVDAKFEQILEEYNSRLMLFIDYLTSAELKSINWPLPESVQHSKTLQYWNSEEIFNSLRKDVGNLFRLNQYKQNSLKDYFKNELELKKIYLNETKYLVDDFKHLKSFVQFILLNSSVTFLNEKFNMEKYCIYVNMDEFKKIDWIQKEEIINKYGKKIEVVKKRSIETNKTTDLDQKEKEMKRFMSSFIVEDKKMEKTELEFNSNYEKFLLRLNKEKENNRVFEDKLLNLAQDEHKDMKNDNLETTQNDTILLDEFLKKLQDEKLKSKQFNDKLNKMLWK